MAYTPTPEKIVAAAARCCYSNDDPDKLLDNMTYEKATKFLIKLNDLSHFSPLEHVSFTFSISGVSRSFLAQITRHRVASFSVRSQRYCNMEDAEVICPNSISGNKENNVLFKEATNFAGNTYSALLDNDVKKEDARFILPEATATAMVVTMNARELLHFFSLRCCVRSQWEIRAVANEMLSLVKNVAPNLFKKAGPSCVQMGYCPEDKMSCGKAPTLKEMKEAYLNQRKEK